MCFYFISALVSVVNVFPIDTFFLKETKKLRGSYIEGIIMLYHACREGKQTTMHGKGVKSISKKKRKKFFESYNRKY